MNTLKVLAISSIVSFNVFAFQAHAAKTYKCGALIPLKGTPVVAGATEYRVRLKNGIGEGGELLSKSGRGVGNEEQSTPLVLKQRGMEAVQYAADDIDVDALAQRMGTSKGVSVSIHRAGNPAWNSSCGLQK